jgi:hypothetical protein
LHSDFSLRWIDIESFVEFDFRIIGLISLVFAQGFTSWLKFVSGHVIAPIRHLFQVWHVRRVIVSGLSTQHSLPVLLIENGRGNVFRASGMNLTARRCLGQVGG